MTNGQKKSAPTTAIVEGTQCNNTLQCDNTTDSIEMQYQPYPNIEAEIEMMCAGHISTYAEHAGVSQELLCAILKGEQELKMSEARGIYCLSRSFTDIPYSWQYLFSPYLSYYDITKHKHRQKVIVALRKLTDAFAQYPDNTWVSLDMLKRFIIAVHSNQYFTRAFINKMLRCAENIKAEQGCKNRKIRSL